MPDSNTGETLNDGLTGIFFEQSTHVVLCEIDRFCKFIHGNDIQQNEGKARAAMQTPEAKARKKKYAEFIQSSKPETV